MLKDRFVRIKIKKHYKEQRALSYVGKVTSMKGLSVEAPRLAILERARKTMLSGSGLSPASTWPG